jgi:hypothetical protein
LNALLKKKPSKYSKIGTISNGGGISKATKSTAAMSQAGGALEGNFNRAQMSTI